MKQLLLLVAFILVAAVSFLFSPPPLSQDEFWGQYVKLGAHTGFVLNGDSYGYIEAAEQPSRLLQPREIRQSRPLYVLLGTALGTPLQAVLPKVLPPNSVAPYLFQEVPIPLDSLIGFYPAFVLLNFVMLLAALWLFARLYQPLTSGRGQPLVMWGLVGFMASSPITKAFFWTAHQQMFAFFTPLFCLWLLYYLRQQKPRSGFWLALAFGAGWLPLLYGNFVLVLPTLLYALWQQRARRWPSRHEVLLALAVVVLFLLPTLGWIGLLKLRGVTYYNHEMERFRQLVWVLDAAKGTWGEFWAEVASNLLEFLNTLWIIAAFAAAVGLLWLATRRLRPRPAFPPLVPDAVFLMVLFGAFLFALGYYPPRLTFTLQPLLLCLAAALLAYLPGRWQSATVLLALLGWHAYNVLSYGPFS